MTEAPSSVVIVGGGLAGAKSAEALRSQGFDGPITLLGAEQELPYERPPLSKGYLAGKAQFTDAIVHDADWYAENKIDLRLDTEVVALHRQDRAVELADGTRVGYAGLVLATGSEPRTLPIPGVERALTLRVHADSDTIRVTFGAGRRLVVIGAGWIGLEVAAAAREQGTDVTVLESADVPLGVLGPEMGAVFGDLHRDHGVDLRCGVSVAEVGDGVVRLADGTQFPADAVVMGVGARPRLDLAVAAGLDMGDGVLVDAALRTSDPAIVAVGDIADHDHPVLGRRVRVEHWATALNQPAVAAATLLGEPRPYTNLPYFFSDQYDLGMEYVGYAPRGSYSQVVVRGDLAGREFVAFWLDDTDRVVAAMNVNVWDVLDDIKPLIAEKAVIDREKLVDVGVAVADARR